MNAYYVVKLLFLLVHRYRLGRRKFRAGHNTNDITSRSRILMLYEKRDVRIQQKYDDDNGVYAHTLVLYYIRVCIYIYQCMREMTKFVRTAYFIFYTIRPEHNSLVLLLLLMLLLLYVHASVLVFRLIPRRYGGRRAAAV